MIGTVVAILLFALVGWRFVRRVRQERRRQRALTWPRAGAVLTGDSDALVPAVTDKHGDVLFYHARLAEPYVFYARGERQTGQQLAPELERLNPEEAKLFLRELGKHRSYRVCYDPQYPERSYFTVGRHLISNRTLLLYAVFGVLLPGILLLTSVPLTVLELPVQLFLYGGILAVLTLLLATYYAAKSVFNLGILLLPASTNAALPGIQSGDELLESLARRPPLSAKPSGAPTPQLTSGAPTPDDVQPASPPNLSRL